MLLNNSITLNQNNYPSVYFLLPALISLLLSVSNLYPQELATKTYIVSLNDDNSSRDYSDYYSTNLTDLNVAGITVLRAMREKSTLSQRSFLNKIENYQVKGDIENYFPLWIIDAVIITTNDTVIDLISADNHKFSIYEDILIFNRKSEPSPIDTSLYHKLLKVVDKLKRASEDHSMRNGNGRKISIIGGTLPDFYPYSPEHLEVVTTDGEISLENGTDNWDWLSVSAAGWKDSWDDRGVATESSIEYFPLFGTGSCTLSDILITLEKLVNVNDTRNMPDVIALTWDISFDDKHKLIWDAINAIEASQIPVILMYPEGSSSSVDHLPGLFVQGYSEDSNSTSDILKVPQYISTPDGSVYMSDLVSLGYAAGSIALLRNANKRSFLKNRYNSLRYVSGNAHNPTFNLSVARAVLQRGTTLIKGRVMSAGIRTPEEGIRVSVETESERKSVATDKNGRYSVRVISEDVLVKIDDLKFYTDSLSASLEGEEIYIADFVLVPIKRISVKGSIISENNEFLNGGIEFYIENELFTSIEITDNSDFEVELVAGSFEVKIFPEFPYAINKLKLNISNQQKQIPPFVVKNADVGIISITSDTDILSYYTGALDSLELSYAYHYWNGDTDLSLYELLFQLEYNTTILYSGATVPLISISSLLEDLNQFIEEGGHVLYTGQKLIEYLSEFAPMKEDGIRFGGNRNELLLYNGKETKLPVYTLLSGGSGADNQTDPDELIASDNFIPTVYYDSQENHIAGGMVYRNIGGNYAILGYGMESIHKPHGSSSFVSKSQTIDFIFKSLWNAPKGSIRIARYNFPNNSKNIRLMRSTPDPMKNKTTIRFYLPQPATVKLELYDMKGNMLSTILNDERDLGGYEVVWYPLNDGLRLVPGIYFITMRVQGVRGYEHLLLSKIVHL